MTSSIEHCINLIGNNTEVFFDLISAVLFVPFNGNIDVALALTSLCKSLASVSSNFNQLIFNLLFREMMALAPSDKPMESEQQIGFSRLLSLRCRGFTSATVTRSDPHNNPIYLEGLTSQRRNMPFLLQIELSLHYKEELAPLSRCSELTPNARLRPCAPRTGSYAPR